MEYWHWWLIAALTLLILEMFFSDFLLATVATACVATAVIAGFGVSFTGQLVAFAVTGVLVLVFLRPAIKRWFYKTSDPTKLSIDGMIGQVGTVADAISGSPNTPGRVKIGGEEWRAFSTDREPIPEGASVEITQVDGATLTVKPN